MNGTRSKGRKSGARPDHAARSSGFLDLDFLGLAPGRLRDGDLQDAVRQRRLDGRRIDARRQLQNTIEHAITSFAEMEILVRLVALLGFDLFFTTDRQHVILK